MALTAIQRDVCRLLAEARKQSGESYLAGGAALGAVLGLTRVSRDLDIFHDTVEAVARSWERDRRLLDASEYRMTLLRERPGYVEAVIEKDSRRLVLEWSRDSAFRFFPLVEHEEFGLMLHPFDLATNKVLALVGRLEPRDWVDVLAAHERLQPLGYLAWAAAGKDPGFTAAGILEHAGRSSRYTQEEIDSLAFEGPSPSAGELSRHWHEALAQARMIVGRLPADQHGTALIATDSGLFRGGLTELDAALSKSELRFHPGRVGGAWPTVTSSN
jgi:hypothetical protein